MSERSAKPDNSANPEPVQIAARLSRLYLDSLRAADIPGAYRVASKALARGMGFPELYQQVITPAMHRIGELWERGAITVADEHLATGVTQRVLGALRPPVRVDCNTGGPGAPGRKAMLAAVQGEQHALGLRMAADIVEDAGFHAIYLGADVPTGALLQTVASLSPDLVALSATMPDLAPRLEEIAISISSAYPGVDLLLGGQAAPSRPVVGAVVQDFEALPAWLEREPG